MIKKEKEYRVIPTKKQIEVLKLYWKMFQAEYDIFWSKIGELERGMSKRTGIKDLEFLHDTMCSGWYGIGNGERTMRLFQREKLE